MREISRRELCHEELGDQFRVALSDYDTQRRVNVLIHEFLRDVDLSGKRAIDVGCGYGFFSRALRNRNANVVACDLGETLVKEASSYADCEGLQADCLELTNVVGESTFDVVVSSECIEHTPDPMKAVSQMAGVLKEGGLIAISTPNVVWYPVVRFATTLRLRPFNGLENFSTWRGLRSTLKKCGIEILQEKGLHLYPFQLPGHRLSTWLDNNMQVAKGLMINICILGRKTGGTGVQVSGSQARFIA